MTVPETPDMSREPRPPSPRGMLGDALVVCALIGTAQMTWGVVVPVLPLFVEELGIPVTVLGIVIAAFAVGRVIANVPAGMALRRVPARPFLLSVLIALAGVTAVTGFVGETTWLIGLRLVAGLLAGAAITLGFAVLFAGAPAAQRGRVISIATIVQMGAAAVGSMIGGVAVTLGGVPAAFASASVPVLIAVAVDVVRPARSYWSGMSRTGAIEETAAVMPPPTEEIAARSSPSLLATLAFVSFAMFFARFAGEQGLLPVLAYGHGGLTPLTLGVAFALGTVASALALAFVGRWVDAGHRSAVLVASIAGVVTATALFGVLRTPWWFGCAIVLYAVATSTANIIPSVVVAEAFPGRRSGSAVGVTRTAGDIGAAIGPIAVFGVVDAVGVWAGLALLALVPLAASAVLLPRIRRPRSP